jgi:uncharacterized lipoprotein YddW (UPF0748 family)
LQQVRALWVDAFHDGIKSPGQVERLVAGARTAGINMLLVQVRRRGDAYYLRTDEPRTDDPQLEPGFDALQALLNAAHGAQPRLEVHAWIATVAVWNARDRAPANPAHVFNRHGPDAPGAETWLSLNGAGAAWDGADYKLDPGHPDVPEYLSGVAQELVRGYDVDGLHLDLIRYAGREWGYNPASLARYRAQTGATGVPAPGDARWQQWRRDQVTALARRLADDIAALNASGGERGGTADARGYTPMGSGASTTRRLDPVKVSAAVIGWGAGPVDERTWRTTSAYRDVYQDWKSWLEDGIVDTVMPMNYNDERDAQQRTWFDQWIAWERAHAGRQRIVPGVGLFLNDPGAGLAQVRRALAPAASGAALGGGALYSYAVTKAPPRGRALPATPNEAFLRALAGESALNGAEAPVFATPAAPTALSRSRS